MSISHIIGGGYRSLLSMLNVNQIFKIKFYIKYKWTQRIFIEIDYIESLSKTTNVKGMKLYRLFFNYNGLVSEMNNKGVTR